MAGGGGKPMPADDDDVWWVSPPSSKVCSRFDWGVPPSCKVCSTMVEVCAGGKPEPNDGPPSAGDKPRPSSDGSEFGLIPNGNIQEGSDVRGAVKAPAKGSRAVDG